MSILKITDQLKNLKAALLAFNQEQKEWDTDLSNESFDKLSDEEYEKVVAILMSIFSKTRDTYNMIKYLIDHLEEKYGNNVSVEELEAMAALASEYDSSGDEVLTRQAQILDLALRHVIAHQEQNQAQLVAEAEEKKVKNQYLERERKEKYDQPRETLAENNKIKGLGEKYSKEMQAKEYRPQQHALSTRYCPEHPGVGVIPLAEGQYQCSLDKRVFDYKEGYTSLEGDKVPGGAVEMQNRTPLNNINTTVNYDTRESRSQK